MLFATTGRLSTTGLINCEPSSPRKSKLPILVEIAKFCMSTNLYINLCLSCFHDVSVTRLLKVSQKAKSPPPSLLHAAPDSSSNISFPSFNSKITAAQAELQACESHLAENERDLEKHRIHAIRQGLKLRCEALVHCGWVWGEMGRRALSMLEDLNGIPIPANGHGECR